MQEPREASVPTVSGLSWLARSAVAPHEALTNARSQARASRVSSVLLLLAVLWTAGTLILPATTPAELAKSPIGLTLILVAVPFTLFCTYLVSRTTFTWLAAAFGLGVAAVGTVVVASYDPALAAAASSFFLFAILVTVGSLFLPLQAALLIGLLNLMSSMIVPHLLPQAGPAALQIPYLFLGLNAVLFLVVAPVRERDGLAMEAEILRSREARDLAKAEAELAQVLRLEGKSKDDLLRAA